MNETQKIINKHKKVLAEGIYTTFMKHNSPVGSTEVSQAEKIKTLDTAIKYFESTAEYEKCKDLKDLKTKIEEL